MSESARVGAARVWVTAALLAACAHGCVRPGERQAESASAADTPERVTLAWHDVPLDPTHRELEPVAPVRLTARDGTALDLAEVTAQGAVVGLFAFTELHLTFKNPVARELVGTFAFTLPPSGAVSRFAVRGKRRLMEGEIVEHRLARSVYEDFLPLEVAPALFEHDAGNGFTARVFRIAAHKEKQIVVSYSEELSAENPSYRIPLRGLGELQALTVVVHRFEPADSRKAGPDRHRVYRVEKTRFVPDRDFTLPLIGSAVPPAQAPSAVAVQAGRFAVVRVTPIQEVPDPPKKLAILIDTSASRALSLTRDVERVPGDDPRAYPIEFSQGSASPFDDNLWLISHVLGMMQRDPKLRVVVRGHADDERNAAKNLRLSEDRARVVRDHMISSGASSRRLVATGCGSSRPLAGAHPDQPTHKRFVDFVTVEESFEEALCAAPLPPTPHGQPLRATIPRPWAKRVPEPPRAPAVYYQPLRKVAPYQGPFADVMADLAAGRAGDALAKARAMHAKDPGAVPSLFALGSSYEALGRPGDAARAYASILDLYPSYAPYRRFAGSLFDRLGIAQSPNAARARELAVHSYRHALSKLPDNASAHRLYAFALLRAGRYQEAFDILDRASQHSFPVHVSNVFESDLALVARAWAAAEPANTGLVTGLLAARHIPIDDRPSLRIALTWEYESDVNLHLDTGQQPQAGDDFARSFPGRLVTEGGSGLGPAVFMIYGPTSGRTLRLGVHLASISNEKRFTLGKVELIRHDGAGHLSFDERPFALMVRESYAELGSVEI